ncbi:uncharacterized protein [Haliotis asinina]|uniref:uncharacterized protein n=1 Tax=Haliotis asinina TaxID=109174 RepID=UPI0035325BC3
MGVSHKISSHEMNNVMKRAVEGVLCAVIYGMDPKVMLPMIRETGILTVGGNDPYYGELSKMIRRGTEDDSVINHRLLDILFTRDKWWIVFIRVCQQCEYNDVIEAIEGKLTTNQISELHQQIQCSTRQGSMEGRAERQDQSPSHTTPGVRQHSCEQTLFSQTMAKQSTPRTDTPHGNIPWDGSQWDTRSENRPSNTDQPPGPLNELSQRHMQTQICSSQSGSDRKPDGLWGWSLSDSRRQEKLSSDSKVFDETLAKASTRTTESARGSMHVKGGQMDLEYQNIQMNSNIGRSPGRLIDDEKEINITKEVINYAPKTDVTDTNNLSVNPSYNFRKFKTAVEATPNIGWNILVPDKYEVSPDSILTTRRESNMGKVGNVSLENPKIQNHLREDAMDTSVVTDDATNKWTYPNFQHGGVDSHHDNVEGDEDIAIQASPATGGSDTVPYVSDVIIQAQLDLQKKRHGAALDREQVTVEHDSTEKQSLEADPPDKEHRHNPRSEYHHPEKTYRQNVKRVKSQDTNIQFDHQLKVMNTEIPKLEFPASAKTRGDSDVPCVSGPNHVSENFNPAGNIPNFGLLGDASIETTIQGDDISPSSANEEISPNAISERPGDDTLSTVDNGTNPTDPTKVMTETRRSSPNTDAETSHALQQACLHLRETSGGSVYLSPHYSSRSGYPQVADYTHIAPPAHVVSLSDTPESPAIHEALAEMALKQKTEGASPVKPR